MAPVQSTSVGVTPQVIDDEGLLELLARLNSFAIKREDYTKPEFLTEIERLVKVLVHHAEWKFEEQVDLYDWIGPLNAIDASLYYFVRTSPALLLIEPVKRKTRRADEADGRDGEVRYARTLEEAQNVPSSVVDAVCSILRFLSCLLRNCTNKSVFNSVDELVDLLAASSDTITSLALECLSAVASPPALHKLQAPETHQHSSSLHLAPSSTHKRLVAMARGWGSRASGLGLFACATADNSEHGQGSLPAAAGEVNFEFFPQTKPSGDKAETDRTNTTRTELDSSEMISVHLSAEDIIAGSLYEFPDDVRAEGKKKRQRIDTSGNRARGSKTKSTVELFFKCIEMAGGRDLIPEERLFPLLSDVRLAKDFHSSESRTSGVLNRLVALTAIVHAHPSQEIMSGYFQAQPELCVELIDLLRPTVSSATVSSGSLKSSQKADSSTLASIAGLADPPQVPYSVRGLAIEALTALVARRDAASGGLTGVARQSNILHELGVGKGLYLGLLPTLVRYSLASLTNFLTFDEDAGKAVDSSDQTEDAALDIGLAFLEATKPDPLPNSQQLFQALDFVDSVLTLCSAVISAPSGTAALTECGLIPALLSTVAVNSTRRSSLRSFVSLSLSDCDVAYADSKLRFITSQAIQIIEGAIVTHNNALSAFHDLEGVEVLISRLHNEMELAKAQTSADEDTMEIEESQRTIAASRRVLLFSIVNCLTVVFHQESTANSATTPSGGSQLRKPELTSVLIEILDKVSLYGGVLAALTCSLLADVMNGDPHVVYHVHSSGIAAAFFKMVSDEELSATGRLEPSLPPVAEVIMALPNVVAALALTADGAKEVTKANPFPSILKLLYSQKYAMPNSRCMLNEMTAIVGTGFDEIMRHVPNLRSKIMSSIVEAMTNVITLGQDLVSRENSIPPSNELDSQATAIENERTALVQYALNFAQLMEQILHTEDHCDPFVQAGGLTAILDLYPLLIPPGSQFLSNASCLSSPSVSTLAHTTIEDSLSIAFRCIAVHYDSSKMLKTVAAALKSGMRVLETRQRELLEVFPSSFLESASSAAHALIPRGVLEGLPRETLCSLPRNHDYTVKTAAIANYLHAVVILQWHTTLLNTVIKGAVQRSQEGGPGGTGWSRLEREWKKELSSSSYEGLFVKLSELHSSAMLEACRIRSEEGFESAFRDRHRREDGQTRVKFRLRIISQEGAVVRDGIEIDSCASVGSMEMGEVAEAYDRCVNSSGVMRYRTRRGWVSELTRGHGREPIAEVIDIRTIDAREVPAPAHPSKDIKRIEYRIANLSSVGASVFARLQHSHKELLSSLSRVLAQGIRSLPLRTLTFQPMTVGVHTRTMLRIVSSGLTSALNQDAIVEAFDKETSQNRKSEVAMFLGTLIGIVNACVFEDKRERKIVNTALLLSLLNSDRFVLSKISPLLSGEDENASKSAPRVGICNAAKFIFDTALADASVSVGSPPEREKSLAGDEPKQALSRNVAASLPPLLTMLRKLVTSGSIMKTSPSTNVLSKIGASDLATLLTGSKQRSISMTFCSKSGGQTNFSANNCMRTLQMSVSSLVFEAWNDRRLQFMPAHIVNPLSSLASEIMSGLDSVLHSDTSTEGDERSSEGRVSHRGGGLFGSLMAAAEQRRRGRADGRFHEDQEFEPSEESVRRLMEMGFSREHALDALESTESNRVEVAMEYALTHPTPSPEAAERRRQLRAQARRRREANRQAANDQGGNGESVEESQVEGDTVNAESAAKETAGEDSNGTELDKEAEEAQIMEAATSAVKSSLQGFVRSSWSTSFDLIAGAASREQEGKFGADLEALTVVLSSFAVSVAQKHAERCDEMMKDLLSRIESAVEATDSKGGEFYRVIGNKESEFACFCHALVLFARALPKIRLRILELGLVSRLVHCLESVASSSNISQTDRGAERMAREGNDWPDWVPPVLLLLAIMAQPMSAFGPAQLQETKDCSEDYGLVRADHRKEAERFRSLADKLFPSVSRTMEEASTPTEETKPEESGMNEETKALENSEGVSGTNAETNEEKPKQKSGSCHPFANLPPFFPLLPRSLLSSVMKVCSNILGEAKPPPSLAHATLLLVAQLLRSPKLATRHLKGGLADLILGLHSDSRFDGNTGFVTIILRRLLEDDQYLQSSMETEIRATLTKLHRKNGRQSSPEDRPSATKKAFMQAVTPILCRDPSTFLKAAVVTVSFDSTKSSPADNGMVHLLTPEQRSRNLKILNEVIKERKHDSSGPERQPKASSKRIKNPAAPSNASKSSKTRAQGGVLTRRNSSPKKRKERNEKKSDGLNGSPPNHVMSLLIGKLLDICSHGAGGSSDSRHSDDSGESFVLFQGERRSFLWATDVLEIMADLVLSVPACAAAIHRYKVVTSKGSAAFRQLTNLEHCIGGSQRPPATVVSFLLHVLLPQDRWRSRQDPEKWDSRNVLHDDKQKLKNKEAFLRTKAAQATARLLVALIARPGEGRRRVVADLAFALGGGRREAPTNSVEESSGNQKAHDSELCALQAWGELCIGLAAPRSNGQNHESNSALSHEVVKLMMDFKMVHALVSALGKVKLEHPMASHVCASLLSPIEVFSRGVVVEAIHRVADSEVTSKAIDSEDLKLASEKKRKQGRSSFGPSQRVESAFADDAMLEDGFDEETAVRSGGAWQAQFNDPVIDPGVDSESVIDDDIEMDDDGDVSEDEDDEMDEESSVEDDTVSAEETASDEDMGEQVSGSDGEEDGESIEDTNEDDAGEAVLNDEEGWVENGVFFDGGSNDEGVEGMGDPHEDENIGDEWDGPRALQDMSGMFMGVRRVTRGGSSSRARGFMDAAEAMIGNLLRTGEIQSDAVREIEGTLGIQIVANRGGPGHEDLGNFGLNLPGPIRGRPSERAPFSRQRENEIVGALPFVNQRSIPEVGYGAGSFGRWNDIPSMEYVFGGPSLSSGSRNFDVVTRLEMPSNPDVYPSPSQMNHHLFPGGPAASTHSRTQPTLHPLLAGVDLPPVNALVASLQSQDDRLTRSTQVGPSRRRHGGWGSWGMVGNGLNLRMSRALGSRLGPNQSGRNAGLFSEDGLPIAGTIDDFTSAFEEAFSEAMGSDNRFHLSQEAGTEQNEETNRNSAGGAEEEDDVNNTEAQRETEQEVVEHEMETEGVQHAGPSDLESQSNTGGSDQPLAETDDGGDSIEAAANTDGDGVASSLAAGLRLSPSREENDEETAAPSQDIETSAMDTSSGAAAALEDSDSGEPESATTAEQQEPVLPETLEGEGGELSHGQEESNSTRGTEASAETSGGLECPPGVDPEFFHGLPEEYQREIVEQHQTTIAVASELDETSGLDAEAIAALPEDMRQEVLAQHRRERQMQAPADPSNAEEMDNASFVASLAPDLRREILMTADDALLNSLPPNIIAEAQVLRERASINQRRMNMDHLAVAAENGADSQNTNGRRRQGAASGTSSTKRKHKIGKIRVESDRLQLIYLPSSEKDVETHEPFGPSQLRTVFRLFFLLTPVQPARLQQKIFQNLSTNSSLRSVICNVFSRLLNDDGSGTAAAISAIDDNDLKPTVSVDIGQSEEDFPPRSLIGSAPEVLDSDGMNASSTRFRAASMAANLPMSSRSSKESHVPPIVSSRILETLAYLGKNSARMCLDILTQTSLGTLSEQGEVGTCFEQILDLLGLPKYSKSSTNLEQLLGVVEVLSAPLSALSRNEEDTDITEKDLESAAATGKEWVEVPKVVISQPRLQLLCSILKMESCRDSAFAKVNNITRRLCRVEANRSHVLAELATVAQVLGEEAKNDLKSLNIRMNDAVAMSQKQTEGSKTSTPEAKLSPISVAGGRPSSTVTLSTSSSEIKLLRVLQTLNTLCSDDSLEEESRRKNDPSLFVTDELGRLLKGIELDDLWTQLSSCLKAVKVLEGISTFDDAGEKDGEDQEKGVSEDNPDDGSNDDIVPAKKLQNSSAGLLMRFLPTIEAFFVVNASSVKPDEEANQDEKDDNKPGEKFEGEHSALIGGSKVIEFVAENKVLLNAIIRNNAGLLEKGLKAMVQVSRCRSFLDFDVKRQWFKSQIRRLRQQASRRHGSLRLTIRRNHVFEDAYHLLRIRNADEMRSRLHITFKNEEGVDAGGLSREFFGILAKEMFNPNYGLFSATEDGCTFQPNQHSSINQDHLSYFRFVGGIVGKAVADGYLLDAHFTRSLYKHMLGLEPTYHDMEAIDPDFYKSLKMILEYSLEDIGLDLTFSTEVHSFGRSKVVDLIPNGRNTPVTDETKAKYVSLICKHRMTISIKSQIKAFLDGFYELVSRDLIAIFTPRELELLISGLPDIDVHDLKQNTDYQGWKATDPEIGWFWNIMFSLSRSQKASFLQFVTGSSKVPLAGFAELQGMRGVQKFSIHKVGGSSGALMSAHTCFNSLDLPKYQSEDEMREKLLYAINEGQGAFMFA